VRTGAEFDRSEFLDGDHCLQKRAIIGFQNTKSFTNTDVHPEASGFTRFAPPLANI